MICSKDVAVENNSLIGGGDNPKSEGDSKVNFKIRYYAESDVVPQFSEPSTANICDRKFDLRSRPNLGGLPSYIAFQDS